MSTHHGFSEDRVVYIPVIQWVVNTLSDLSETMLGNEGLKQTGSDQR